MDEDYDDVDWDYEPPPADKGPSFRSVLGRQWQPGGDGGDMMGVLQDRVEANNREFGRTRELPPASDKTRVAGRVFEHTDPGRGDADYKAYHRLLTDSFRPFEQMAGFSERDLPIQAMGGATWTVGVSDPGLHARIEDMTDSRNPHYEPPSNPYPTKEPKGYFDRRVN